MEIFYVPYNVKKYCPAMRDDNNRDIIIFVQTGNNIVKCFTKNNIISNREFSYEAKSYFDKMAISVKDAKNLVLERKFNTIGVAPSPAEIIIRQGKESVSEMVRSIYPIQRKKFLEGDYTYSPFQPTTEDVFSEGGSSEEEPPREDEQKYERIVVFRSDIVPIDLWKENNSNIYRIENIYIDSSLVHALDEQKIILEHRPDALIVNPSGRQRKIPIYSVRGHAPPVSRRDEILRLLEQHGVSRSQTLADFQMAVTEENFDEMARIVREENIMPNIPYIFWKKYVIADNVNAISKLYDVIEKRQLIRSCIRNDAQECLKFLFEKNPANIAIAINYYYLRRNIKHQENDYLRRLILFYFLQSNTDIDYFSIMEDELKFVDNSDDESLNFRPAIDSFVEREGNDFHRPHPHPLPINRIGQKGRIVTEIENDIKQIIDPKTERKMPEQKHHFDEEEEIEKRELPFRGNSPTRGESPIRGDSLSSLPQDVSSIVSSFLGGNQLRTLNKQNSRLPNIFDQRPRATKKIIKIPISKRDYKLLSEEQKRYVVLDRRAFAQTGVSAPPEIIYYYIEDYDPERHQDFQEYVEYVPIEPENGRSYVRNIVHPNLQEFINKYENIILYVLESSDVTRNFLNDMLYMDFSKIPLKDDTLNISYITMRLLDTIYKLHKRGKAPKIERILGELDMESTIQNIDIFKKLFKEKDFLEWIAFSNDSQIEVVTKLLIKENMLSSLIIFFNRNDFPFTFKELDLAITYGNVAIVKYILEQNVHSSRAWIALDDFLYKISSWVSRQGQLIIHPSQFDIQYYNTAKYIALLLLKFNNPIERVPFNYNMLKLLIDYLSPSITNEQFNQIFKKIVASAIEDYNTNEVSLLKIIKTFQLNKLLNHFFKNLPTIQEDKQFFRELIQILGWHYPYENFVNDVYESNPYLAIKMLDAISDTSREDELVALRKVHDIAVERNQQEIIEYTEFYLAPKYTGRILKGKRIDEYKEE